MKKNKAGIAFMTMGLALILSSLGLILYNRWESEAAGSAASSVLSVMRQAIPSQDDPPAESLGISPGISQGSSPGSSRAEEAQEENRIEPEEDAGFYTPPEPILTEPAVLSIDGDDYIGYLSLTTLDLELPVMADWDYAKLKRAPCRQFGSVEGGNLVIAGHNYKSQFGKLTLLSPGDALSFTETTGVCHHYEVYTIEQLPATAVQEVRDSGYDLILYTCNASGQARIAVCCLESQGDE